ncbi:MAG: hypothetical protein ACE5WD_09355 [Candidatus Aminicenantia bacterium]
MRKITLLTSIFFFLISSGLAQESTLPKAQQELFKTLSGLGFILILLIALAFLFFALLGMEILIFSTNPNFATSVKATLTKYHRRSFLWGLVSLTLVLIIVPLLGQLGNIGGLISLIVLVLVIILILFGLSGVCSITGQKVTALTTRKNYSPLTVLIVGFVVLGLGIILPGIGWFILLPYLMIISLGSFLQTKLARRRREHPEEVKENHSKVKR